MPKPDPLYVPWRGRMSASATMTPSLRMHWPQTVRLIAAMTLATDVERLRRVLATTVGDRYRIEVPDDGSEVRLRRRT